MRRVRSAGICVLGLLLCLGCFGQAGEGRPPNIVLIIGDDHGWPYSGFMGNPRVETPVLDQLAENGVVFSQGQTSSSLCRPSLQTLLSGLHPREWRAKREAIEAEVGDLPNRSEVSYYRTLPGELARVGYRSWEGGKHWEGSFADAGFSAGLAERSHHDIYTIHGGKLGREDWDPRHCGPGRDPSSPCEALRPLRDFLDADDDSPFFVWFAPKLPHVPFDAPQKYLAAYPKGSATDSAADGGGHFSFDESAYFGQVTRLDAVIGELLNELERRGLLDDTLVVYLSDNGWQIGQSLDLSPGGGPLYGKGSLYDLGTRTPVVFHWPTRLRPRRIDDVLVTSEDLFATLLDLGGADALPDRSGMSLRSTLLDGAPFERSHYVSELSNLHESMGERVRTLSWHYLVSPSGEERLFDIARDPLETQDLAFYEPERVREFRTLVRDWETEVESAPKRLDISGRLLDEEGFPIGGARLALRGSRTELESETDSEGRYLFRNLAHGQYTIVARSGVSSLRLGPLRGVIPQRIPVGPTGRHTPELLGVPEPASGR